MVQQSREDSTGSAIAYLLFGVVGGLGLDLCAKGLLVAYSLEQFVFLLPLVDALTLGFTAPLMVTALSVPMLGEHVGWRRWIAVVAGFIGGAISGRYLRALTASSAAAVKRRLNRKLRT